MENPPRAINVIVQQLHSALSSKKRADGEILSLIDEFINLPFTKNENEYFAIHRNIGQLSELICAEIVPSNDILTSKTSTLLHKFSSKTNHEFSEEHWETITKWRFKGLRVCSGNILTDVLFHMHDNLPKMTSDLAKHAETLIGREGLIITILENQISNQENWNVDSVKTSVLLVRIISYLTVYILQNTKKCTPNISKDRIAQTLMELLMNGVPKECDFFYNMAVEPALRTLAHLFYHNPEMDFSLSDAISIARHFILYGLSIRYTKPDNLTPLEHADVIEPVKITPKAGKKQKLRKPRNNAIEKLKKEASNPSAMKEVEQFNSDVYEPTNKNFLDPPNFVLDSETSTNFSFDMKFRPEVTELKPLIRQYASKLFLVIIKVRGKREIFPYWWKFMPNNPEPQYWFNTENGKKSLIFAALSDSVPKGRSSALSIVLTLLSGSRPYLAQAETSDRTTSVVPFPVTLGYMVTCIHNALIYVLTMEKCEGVAIMALKCTAALAQATPYHKLEPGLIEGLIRCIKKFIKQKDINIQLGSLVAIGSMISVDPKVDEVLRVLKDDDDGPDGKQEDPKTKPDTEPECEDFEESYPDDDLVVNTEADASIIKEKFDKPLKLTSWVLTICFKNFGIVFENDQIMNCPLPPMSVILETLQVLSAIAFHYLGELLRPHLVMVTEMLSDMLRINHPDLTLQCAKTISVIADGMEKLESSEHALWMKERLYVWERLLGPLCGVLQSHENPSAKAVVCDCIANIGEKCFKEMLRPQQLLCCALLIGSCSDEQPGVRAAAVRALAMAVMYRTLREDICFVSDCAENILRALAEPTLQVRAKAAWALANMSDALVLNTEVPELDRISDELLMRLLQASVASALDNDKVKMSAMRSTGNLLRILTRENVSHNSALRPLFDTAISRLLMCASHGASMKVRWNACYALGNAMKNECLFIYFQGWQGRVFPGLCKLAQNTKNIKVRITAAVALRSCARRWQVGPLLAPLWRGVAEALYSAAHLDDFTEYKHKDNLAEQLCVTLAHITCFLEPADLSDILDPLTYHGETAKTIFAEVYHKLLPEDASCLKILQAAKFVNMDLVAENETQARALNMLKNIFSLEV